VQNALFAFVLSTRNVKNSLEIAVPPRLVLECTAYAAKDLPALDLPQFALAGRSNVGKSSLINALAGCRRLAKVGSTPGKTRSVNFYRAQAEGFYLVDLPGYGYARCSKDEQLAVTRLVEGYLTGTRALKALILLLDCRLDAQSPDIALAAFAAQNGIELLPVLAKTDKCARREQTRRRQAWSVLLDGRAPLLCSSAKGTGLEELWTRLCSAAARPGRE
jgi:GTP-binding protein